MGLVNKDAVQKIQPPTTAEIYIRVNEAHCFGIILLAESLQYAGLTVSYGVYSNSRISEISFTIRLSNREGIR